MPDMTLMVLAVAVAPCTGKIIKNEFCVFEGGENLLHFALKLSQSSEIVLQS